MKKKFLLIIFSVAAFSLAAQEVKSEQSESKVPRHEVTIGTADIFKKNTDIGDLMIYSYMDLMGNKYSSLENFLSVPSVGLGYKVMMNGNAIRLNVYAKTNNKEQTKYDEKGQEVWQTKQFDQALTNMYTSLGYEYRVTKGKSQFFFGVDFFYEYFDYSETELIHYDEEYTKTYNHDKKISSYENSTESSGAAPFVGVSFKITPNLLISTETSYKIKNYSLTSKSIDEYKLYGTLNGEIKNDDSYTGLSTTLCPMGVISISFLF